MVAAVMIVLALVAIIPAGAMNYVFSPPVNKESTLHAPLNDGRILSDPSHEADLLTPNENSMMDDSGQGIVTSDSAAPRTIVPGTKSIFASLATLTLPAPGRTGQSVLSTVRFMIFALNGDPRVQSLLQAPENQELLWGELHWS